MRRRMGMRTRKEKGDRRSIELDKVVVEMKRMNALRFSEH